ncbi:polymorphic toxin-type HINT domain-containing protein [Streptomyces sp. NPDC060198]|uniref:polymorphic toxin-type HINT domain-containing protein n=1 Tax=Streptomyces sp. NPDC060198 TaxID=3347070 RepID=UPI003647EDFC
MAGEAFGAFMAARSSLRGAGSCLAPNSFTADTPVLMADGTTKPVQDIRIGDEAWSTDPETDESGPRPVTALIKGQGEKQLVDLLVDTDGTKGEETGSITATDGHPFWVPALDQWLEAGELQPGQWLRTSAGTWVQLTATQHTTRSATVYNLTVDDLHTYYAAAGAAPLLVHNCPPGGGFCSRPVTQQVPPTPDATVADLRTISLDDVGGTAGSKKQLEKLVQLTDDELLRSVFSLASGPGDVLTVGQLMRRLENGNHRAGLLIDAARKNALTGAGTITWQTPIYTRGREHWIG